MIKISLNREKNIRASRKTRILLSNVLSSRLEVLTAQILNLNHTLQSHN